MFQVALILTFDDRMSDQCLFNVLDSYANLGIQIRQVHSEVLAQSLNIPKNDQRSLEALRRWMGTYDAIDHEEEQRCLDVMKLAAMERGEAPPDRAF